LSNGNQKSAASDAAYFLQELPSDLVEDAEALDKKPVDRAAGKKMFEVLRSVVSDT
jgi:hypothetical protein